MRVSVLDLDTWILHFLGYIACVLCVCMYVCMYISSFWRSYLKLTAVIDTNYGKTTRIPNILETGTLLKHGTKISEINFKKLQTAIKIFWFAQIFWVGRLTANKQYFNLGLMYLCVRGITFASFYDFAIGFWNCSVSVVFFVFHFITKLKCSKKDKIATIFKVPSLWYHQYTCKWNSP